MLFITALLMSGQIMAQSDLNSFPKSVDWKKVSSIVKQEFIYKIKSSNKYDSTIGIDKKENNLSKSNLLRKEINLTLLHFEQDFDTDTSYYYEYDVLISVLGSETCHGCKIVDSRTYVLKISLNETFNKSDLVSYQKNSGIIPPYSDLAPWRTFKSFSRKIELKELTPIKID